MSDAAPIPATLARPLLETTPLPHAHVQVSPGRRLVYEGAWNPGGLEGRLTLDGATWLSPQGLRVIATDVQTPHGVLRHVSLSYRTRDPDWREIKAIRAAFFPDEVDAMLLLPQAEDYVAGVPGWEDSRVFHLWQCPTAWGMR
jgi:hypothetical protein